MAVGCRQAHLAASEHIKQRLFGLQSGAGSEHAGGMAIDAKSKKNPAAVALGRLGGLRGGPARAKMLTAASGFRTTGCQETTDKSIQVQSTGTVNALN
jgi:hypothetical protein